MLQFRDSVNLHPIDAMYSDLKEFNEDRDFDPSMLEIEGLRQEFTSMFYKYMKKVAETSNHNLVRNSNAFLANGGKTDPDSKFEWINSSHTETREKFQMSY